MSAPKQVDEYTVFRPKWQYLAMLWGSAAAVLVIGFVCSSSIEGVTGRGLALLVVGGILILVSLLLGADVCTAKSALYLGTDGFRDAGMLGDSGFVTWDRVEDVEVRSQSLVRLYMLPPSGFEATEHQLGPSGMESRRGNVTGPGPKALVAILDSHQLQGLLRPRLQHRAPYRRATPPHVQHVTPVGRPTGRLDGDRPRPRRRGWPTRPRRRSTGPR